MSGEETWTLGRRRVVYGSFKIKVEAGTPGVVPKIKEVSMKW